MLENLTQQYRLSSLPDNPLVPQLNRFNVVANDSTEIPTLNLMNLYEEGIDVPVIAEN